MKTSKQSNGISPSEKLLGNKLPVTLSNTACGVMVRYAKAVMNKMSTTAITRRANFCCIDSFALDIMAESNPLFTNMLYEMKAMIM